ncbi:Homeodomain-like protein, partial [Cunninghamella echinulata]
MPTFYNPFETKHRRRTSRAQFKILETSFYENAKPNATMRRWLAHKLGMTPRSVQVWFQNRRAKAK